MAHVIGGLVGLAVFFLGAVMLETGASSPGSAYEPAQLKDGKISSGRFTEGPDGGE
ncbi:MAG: hypothetical protein VXW25_06090 [Pseudomonadota bacterium]|nr:hypothetical protein [Pseudomonadota bacterium]